MIDSHSIISFFLSLSLSLYSAPTVLETLVESMSVNHATINNALNVL